MLVLTLNPGSWIQIGPEIFIQLPPDARRPARVVIDAPKSVEILRKEAKRRERKELARAC